MSAPVNQVILVIQGREIPSLAAVVRMYVERVVMISDRHPSLAAKRLGIGRSTLYRYLREWKGIG